MLDKQKLKAKKKRYRETHKEAIREYNKKYRKDYRKIHKEVIKKQDDKYRETHQEAIKKRKRAYEKAHPKVSTESRLKANRERKTKLSSRFSRMKSRASCSGKECYLSFEEYCRVVVEPCFYCNNLLGKRPTVGVGLDRLNSSKGYITDNVVACCHTCNRIKGDTYLPRKRKQPLLQSCASGDNENRGDRRVPETESGHLPGFGVLAGSLIRARPRSFCQQSRPELR